MAKKKRQAETGFYEGKSMMCSVKTDSSELAKWHAMACNEER